MPCDRAKRRVYTRSISSQRGKGENRSYACLIRAEKKVTEHDVEDPYRPAATTESEPAPSISAWLRIALIITSVGGGFAGFALTLQLLSKLTSSQLGNVCVALIFLALYAYVIAAGLLFAQDARRTALLYVALALQVPRLSSPWVAYQFASGLYIALEAGSFGRGGGLKLGLTFGSVWQFSMFQPAPMIIGINLFAVLMLVLLHRAMRRERTKQQQTGSSSVIATRATADDALARSQVS